MPPDPEKAARRPSGEKGNAREEESRGSDRWKVGNARVGVNGPRAVRPSVGSRAYLAAIRIRWFDRGLSCYEAQEVWATRIDVDVRTIRRWERELARARLVHVEQRGNKRVLSAAIEATSPPEGPHTEADTAVRVGGPGEQQREADRGVLVPGQAVQAGGQQCPPSRGVEADEQRPSPCPVAGQDRDARKARGPADPAPEGVPPALWGLTRPLREAGIVLDQPLAWTTVGSWLMLAARQGRRAETVEALLRRYGRGSLDPGLLVWFGREGLKRKRAGATFVLPDDDLGAFKAERESREESAMAPETAAVLDSILPPAPAELTEAERLEQRLRKRATDLAQLKAMADEGRAA